MTTQETQATFARLAQSAQALTLLIKKAREYADVDAPVSVLVLLDQAMPEARSVVSELESLVAAVKA